MNTFNQLQELYVNHSQLLKFDSEPEGLYKAVDYILAMKGKRIRPALLLMACDLFEGKLEHALSPAFAVELFHNSTLIHDDIMDEADIRRGQPAVHKVFGLNRAILAGDVMMFYTYKYLRETNPKYILEIVHLFNQTAIQIFEGQQLDILFEKRTEVKEEEYLKMIRHKTAVLIAASLQIGAIIGNADNEDQAHMYQFGSNLGVAFQLKDDYLDAFSKADKFGKKIGGDIVQNKKTFLWIRAYNDSNPAQRKQLLSLGSLADESKKINGVLELFDDLMIKEKTETKMQEYFDKGLENIMKTKVQAERKQNLIQLGESIYNRKW